MAKKNFRPYALSRLETGPYRFNTFSDSRMVIFLKTDRDSEAIVRYCTYRDWYLELHHDRVHYDFKVRLSDSKRKLNATRDTATRRDQQKGPPSSCPTHPQSLESELAFDKKSHTSAHPTDSQRHLPDTVTAATTPVNTAMNFASFVDGHIPVPQSRKSPEKLPRMASCLGREQ